MAEPIDLAQRRLKKMLHTPAPWETKAHNEMVLDRIRGVAAQPSTPESDADPSNPNAK